MNDVHSSEDEGSATILAIDDNLKFLSGLRQYLRSVGFKNITTCSDGISGIRLASEIKPEIVLLDIQMPGMDGFEVVEKLKRENINTKVIIFSVLNDAASGIRAVNIGASDFIPKAEFFELAEIKIRNTLRYGVGLLDESRSVSAILNSSLDEIEQELAKDKKNSAALEKVRSIRSALSNNSLSSEEKKEHINLVREIAVGASGNLAAEGIVAVLSAVAGMI